MEVVVRQGDTLWHYSQLFKLNITLLIDSNPNIQPDLLSNCFSYDLLCRVYESGS